MLFIVYHAEADWTWEQHLAEYNRGLEGSVRGCLRVVVVMSCWVGPEQQTQAMKQVSYERRDLHFLTYRIPNLVVTEERLSVAVSAIANAVRYSNPYLQLVNFCTLRSRAVLFREGCGPYQLAHAALPACSCGQPYPSANSRRVSGAADAMRFRSCSHRRTGCLYLLYVPAAVSAPVEC